MSTSGKGGVVALVALGGGLLLLTAGKKKAQAATSSEPIGAVPPTIPHVPVPVLNPDELDTDVILPTPAGPTSPGWPQVPVASQPSPSQPVPIFPPSLPEVPITLPQVTLPATPPVPIPTSLPSAPVTLEQDGDDDKPPTPANVEVPPIVIEPRPPTHPAELPMQVSEDTALMVQRLLAAEAKPNWKAKDPVVLAWQKARNLVADGQFGPTTALMVADEIGTVPLVRFWPKGTYPGDGTLENYQAELISKAHKAPTPRKEQLLAASQREQGQGYARNVKAADALITLEAV